MALIFNYQVTFGPELDIFCQHLADYGPKMNNAGLYLANYGFL